jgi:peptidyl-tRNA hydrolase, PTH1 family
VVIEADSKPWMVVGLGNPGERYEGTRHNVGFSVIDSLARSLDVKVGREECGALVGRTRIGDSVVELVKPMTFMNLSGEPLACLLAKEGRSLEKTIVIYDDLALPLGSLRVRPKGSHGGHNGMRSIIARSGTDSFPRVRIGIMPEHPVTNVSDFVLGKFGSSERQTVLEAIEDAAKATEVIIRFGIEKAMQEFN